MGSKVEREIVTSLAKNTTLLNFGMGFDTQGPRIACAEILVRNNDFREYLTFGIFIAFPQPHL